MQTKQIYPHRFVKSNCKTKHEKILAIVWLLDWFCYIGKFNSRLCLKKNSKEVNRGQHHTTARENMLKLWANIMNRELFTWHSLAYMHTFYREWIFYFGSLNPVDYRLLPPIDMPHCWLPCWLWWLLVHYTNTYNDFIARVHTFILQFHSVNIYEIKSTIILWIFVFLSVRPKNFPNDECCGYYFQLARFQLNWEAGV